MEPGTQVLIRLSLSAVLLLIIRITPACQLFGDERGGVFLLQRVSVLVQRYSAVLLHDTLPAPNYTD